MFHRLCAAAAAVAVLIAASACTDSREVQRATQLASQRMALSSQLQEVDTARTLASQALAAQIRRVEVLGEVLAAIQYKAAAHQRAVRAFMLDHKMAVAALAAGAAGGPAALDDSGSVSQEAREMGAVVGMVAIGWALFNMEEVLQVASELVKAESAAQALAERAKTLAQALGSEREALQQSQAGYERAIQQVAGIRSALQSL